MCTRLTVVLLRRSARFGCGVRLGRVLLLVIVIAAQTENSLLLANYTLLQCYGITLSRLLRRSLQRSVSGVICLCRETEFPT
jgi:hypothetical protein